MLSVQSDSICRAIVYTHVDTHTHTHSIDNKEGHPDNMMVRVWSRPRKHVTRTQQMGTRPCDSRIASSDIQQLQPLLSMPVDDAAIGGDVTNVALLIDKTRRRYERIAERGKRRQ